MGGSRAYARDFYVSEGRKRSGFLSTGKVELLLCVGMCLGAVSAYVLLRKKSSSSALVVAAIVGCLVSILAVSYAIFFGAGAVRRSSRVCDDMGENGVGFAVEMQDLLQIGDEDLSDAAEDEVHSEDCVACMPEKTSELISGRYADIVGRLDVANEYGIEGHCSGEKKEAYGGRAKVKSAADRSNDRGECKRNAQDGELRVVCGEIKGYHSHIIHSVDESQVGSLDDVVSAWRNGDITLVGRNSANGQVVLRVGNSTIDKCKVLAHVGGSPFPTLDRGFCHIVHRVEFPRGFSLLPENDILFAEGGCESMRLFCRVSAMMEYDNLVKLMFSRELKDGVDGKNLFLLYLGFYYKGLKEYVEHEGSFLGDIPTRLGNNFSEAYLGKRLMRDIVKHKNDFNKAIDVCSRGGGPENATKLCTFAQVVRDGIPDDFVVCDDESSRMLFSAMSCMYAVACSDQRYFVKTLPKVIEHALLFIFFSSDQLREALVLQAISDEIVARNKEVKVESPFFISKIQGLRECVGLLLDVLLKPAGEHEAKIKELYEGENENGKNVAAALVLHQNPGIAIPKGVDAKNNADYVYRNEYYSVRRTLCQNPCIDSKFNNPGDAMRSYVAEKKLLVPYAVVDTVINLTAKYGVKMTCTGTSDLNEYVQFLNGAKNERVVEFLGPTKSFAMGREFFPCLLGSDPVEAHITPNGVSSSAVISVNTSQVGRVSSDMEVSAVESCGKTPPPIQK